MRNPSFDQAAIERRFELRLAHHLAAGVTAMELLDRPVKRRPVDQRMVRGDRHPDHMAVLVLQRTAEVVVDLPEAQRERLGVRPAWGGGRRLLRGKGGQALTGRRGQPRSARLGPGQIERLEHERRDPTRAPTAVVRGVTQDQLVARAGQPDIEQAALLAQMTVAVDRALAEQRGRDRQRVTPAAGREPAVDEARP